MRIRIAVPEEHVSPSVIDATLEAVTRLDESMIRQGTSPTSHQLIASGAKWRPENMGDEHFDHGGTIAARGWGDCDDWAPLHAGTLRATGEDPGATARVIPSGPSTYHAIVQRSDGTIDDPSVAAGMRPLRANVNRVSGAADAIEIIACDPHDGRLYHGSLLPSVGPLSLHCGPAFAVRGVPGGYEARCDLPMSGSPLVGMRHHARRGRHHKRVRGVSVVGQVPYFFSCTGAGTSKGIALSRAIDGAVLCGDASGLTTSLDRYKLLAVQAHMHGMPAAHMVAQLAAHVAHDVGQEAAGTPGTTPEAFVDRLVSEAEGEGMLPHGLVLHDPAHAIDAVARAIVRATSPHERKHKRNREHRAA